MMMYCKDKIHIEPPDWRHTGQLLIIQRVYSIIHCLNHLCPLPAELLARLYHVFVLPILDYCDVVWAPSSVHHFKCLERLHSRFNSSPSSNNLSTSVTITEWRRFHAAIQMYKILHKLSPAVDITLCTGRNIYRLFVPRVQTTLAKHSFYYRGPQIWNSLNRVLYTIQLESLNNLNRCTNLYIDCLCKYVLLCRALLKSNIFILKQSPFIKKKAHTSLA